MAGLIKRGDIWIINLDPGFGREIHKKRPAVIISSNELNKISKDIIIIPSSSIIPSKLSEEIVSVLGVSGFEKPSVLLPLLIRSIDEKRLIKKVGDLPEEKMLELEESLKLVLGLIDT